MKRIFLINHNIDYIILSMQSEYFLQINYPNFSKYMSKIYNLFIVAYYIFVNFVYYVSLISGI